MSNSFFDFHLINVSEADKILDACKGHLKKGVFVCLSKLDDTDKAFLTKILAAVKLDLENEVFVLEKTPDMNLSFGSINSSNSIKNVLLFGLAPSDIGVNVQYQKCHPFVINQVSFLVADKLDKTSSDQNLKRTLWNNLKDFFK